MSDNENKINSAQKYLNYSYCITALNIFTWTIAFGHAAVDIDWAGTISFVYAIVIIFLSLIGLFFSVIAFFYLRRELPKEEINIKNVNVTSATLGILVNIILGLIAMGLVIASSMMMTIGTGA